MTIKKAFAVDGRALTLGQRLEQCIAAAGGLNKASEAMGMTPQGLRRLVRENSDELHAGKRGGPLLPIVELAKAAGVTTDWIATGHDRRPDLGPVQGKSGFAVLYHYEASPKGQLVEVEDLHDAAVALRHDWLATLGVKPAEVGLMTMKGDAMAPTLKDGALLIVDRSAKAITGDGIYALLMGRGLAVRRAQVLLDGSLKLIADNATYAPELVGAKAASEIKIAGRVRAAIVTL